MQNYRIGGNDNYSGVGQTTRKSKVEAIVSCVITRVLPNGHLVISGERMVDVNNDSEIIQISGIIRPMDIDMKNTIDSHQVAQFNISLKGKGVVNSKKHPAFYQTSLIGYFNYVTNFYFDFSNRFLTPVFSEGTMVKIKDISRVIESRDNQLFGYGLVVGLRNTGDTNVRFLRKKLQNFLRKWA